MGKKRSVHVPSLGSDDICVENTNSESLLSKLSVVDAGYRVDPFLKIFRTNDQGLVKRSPRSAAINRGYLARMIALECSLEKYLLMLSAVGIKHQVLSLGAGYDSLYFRLRNQGIIKSKHCSYFEVDFPVVPLTKWHFISKNALLKSFFKLLKSSFGNECFSFDDGSFNMVGCNMTDTENLEKRLDALNFNWMLPTIVFCECSLTYVESTDSIALTSWLTRKISHLIFIDYEQIHPDDSFGQIMVRHFQKRNSTLKCIKYYPSICDHKRRFLSLGWKRCSILNIDTVFRQNHGLHEQKRWKNIDDQFDEPEEFISKCTHYILFVGSNSDVVKASCLSIDAKTASQGIQNTLTSNIIHRKRIQIYENVSFNVKQEVFQRYGHCIWRTPENDIVIFGGYSQKTFRDSLITTLNQTKEFYFVETHRNCFPSKETLFSASAQTNSFNVYVFGGRASPDAASNKLYVLDPYGNNIQEIICNTNIPEARWKHSLTAKGDDKLILIGGKNRYKYFADVYIYDIIRNKWKLLLKLPSGIYSHSTCSWFCSNDKCDKVVISGGLDGHGNVNEKIYILRLNEKSKVSRYW